jgi:hypothetical protein
MTGFEREMFNIVLVHTARTWERIRIEQPYEEMPADNIGSVNEIIQIAEEIVKLDPVLVKFIGSASDEWDWFEESGEDFSDTYIEKVAEQKIMNEFF